MVQDLWARPSDWQLVYSDIRERTEHLLQAGLWTDCTFVVGKGSEQVVFTAHKVFLAIASPVFEAMLYGMMKESDKPIVVTDILPEAFKVLLEYVYTDNIKIRSCDMACEILYAAKKYMLPKLEDRCADFIISNVTTMNACEIYEVAKLFEVDSIISACTLHFIQFTKKVLDMTDFSNIRLDTLIAIFGEHSLNIDSELDLFKALEKYVEAQGLCLKPIYTEDTNRIGENVKATEASNEKFIYNEHTAAFSEEEILKGARKVLHQIRFRTLTLQELANGPMKSPLLPRADACQLLIASAASLEPPPPYSASTVPRNEQYIRKPSPSEPQPTEAEAVCHFTINNFKTRKRQVKSTRFPIHNLDWRIEMVPTVDNFNKSMGVYVGAEHKDPRIKHWSCDAVVTLRLINETRSLDVVKKFVFKYNQVMKSRGYNFGLWDEICDPNRGFLKSNTIMVEAHIVCGAAISTPYMYSARNEFYIEDSEYDEELYGTDNSW